MQEPTVVTNIQLTSKNLKEVLDRFKDEAVSFGRGAQGSYITLDTSAGVVTALEMDWLTKWSDGYIVVSLYRTNPAPPIKHEFTEEYLPNP